MDPQPSAPAAHLVIASYSRVYTTDPSELINSFHSVVQVQAATLKRLEVTFNAAYGALDFVLQHAGMCHNLEDLVLHFVEADLRSVTAESVRRAIRAWPKLRTFHIGQHPNAPPYKPDQNLLGPSTLFEVALGLKHLRHLCLPITFLPDEQHSTPHSRDRRTADWVNLWEKRLKLSPIESFDISASYVAGPVSVLRVLFRNLRTVHTRRTDVPYLQWLVHQTRCRVDTRRY